MAKIFPIGKYLSHLQKLAEIEVVEKELAHKRKKLCIKLVKLLTPFTNEWEPEYNEKAVYLMPESGTAWHVWFVEKRGDFYRFKEIPANLYGIENYYSFSKQNQDISKQDFCIIPITLYEEMIKSEELDICLYDDKHLTCSTMLTTKPKW